MKDYRLFLKTLKESILFLTSALALIIILSLSFNEMLFTESDNLKNACFFAFIKVKEKPLSVFCLEFAFALY